MNENVIREAILKPSGERVRVKSVDNSHRNWYEVLDKPIRMPGMTIIYGRTFRDYELEFLYELKQTE